jgi:predicted ATP-dependent Lon-type protease
MLISGGEVTVPKLFVNNSNGRIGLIEYWDVVAFDEFAGNKKRTDKALVDIMKKLHGELVLLPRYRDPGRHYTNWSRPVQ